MFTILRAFFVSLMLMFSYNASADFFGGSDCPPWEYDCNDWPEWTPMYWMEEMSDEFDDNNDDWYRYGGGPYGGPRPYGPPMMPYGGAPYGGPAPMPYGAPAPMPYGGPAPMPYGRPAPAPYGRPPMPYGAPQQAPSAPAQK